MGFRDHTPSTSTASQNNHITSGLPLSMTRPVTQHVCTVRACQKGGSEVELSSQPPFSYRIVDSLRKTGSNYASYAHFVISSFATFSGCGLCPKAGSLPPGLLLTALHISGTSALSNRLQHHFSVPSSHYGLTPYRGLITKHVTIFTYILLTATPVAERGHVGSRIQCPRTGALPMTLASPSILLSALGTPHFTSTFSAFDDLPFPQELKPYFSQLASLSEKAWITPERDPPLSAFSEGNLQWVGVPSRWELGRGGCRGWRLQW
ncbi:hypothetical protein GWK47_036964 [Chionoecetes opilio]|uniref:Uncharacterized protein n=1 Tax=Chionoecetes opilio TaxID=41210 RepID=A0A8J4YM48_CHIOP|nr:hypothetical protein GWK47_036964 [Chionoecetes opilio]